jgi:hypothetical protein
LFDDVSFVAAFDRLVFRHIIKVNFEESTHRIFFEFNDAYRNKSGNDKWESSNLLPLQEVAMLNGQIHVAPEVSKFKKNAEKSLN